MKRIINSKVKKARARIENRERRKIRWKSHRIIRYLAKQYKKTGSTSINIDVYKFNEEKLIKVLNLLQAEKQIKFIKNDDMYLVEILTESEKTIKNKIERKETNKKEFTIDPKDDPDSDEYEPF